jgi:hypothetical protein
MQTMFSVESASRLYKKDPKPADESSQPRVEAGLNTYTLAMRVVGGDEKRTQCLGV